MKRYYDNSKNRLVYIGEKATPAMWDRRWGQEDLDKLFSSALSCREDRSIVDVTRKYLPPGARLLEGGCGLGDKVYFLKKSGYNITGIDSAAKTVEKLHEFMPDLDIRYGDLAELEFNEGYFDGYWSLGVIEHFYSGYEHITREMFRVLKPNGYLFMTVPDMSPLRMLKAALGIFPRFQEHAVDLSGFYQFAYGSDEIVKTFSESGFQFIEKQGWAIREGVRSEIPGSRFLIGLCLRYFEKLTWDLLRNYCNHMVLYVFQKRSEVSFENNNAYRKPR
jgi:SAM-dependent methyltransferase